MGDYRKTRHENVYWRGRVLYYRVKMADGRWREFRFGKDQSAKEADRARWTAQDREDRIAARTADPRAERMAQHARRPMADVIGEYIAHLRGKGDGANHVKLVESYLKRWADACNVHRLADADANAMAVWLAGLDRSARTRNYIRSSVLGLTNWAATFGRAPYNACPAGLVPKANEDADRRRLSASLTAEQFNAILDAAPLQRRAFYLVAGLTGLRWREIHRLTWSDVDVERAVIVAQAGRTKNRRRAELPMIGPVASALAEYAAGLTLDRRQPAARVFATMPTLRTWKIDLVRAGVVTLVNAKLPLAARYHLDNLKGYVDDRGRQFDRKCLRLSFNVWLKEQGVDLRDATDLMRHSDPRLTAKVYSDPRLSHLSRQAERLQQHFNKERRDAV